MTAPVYYVFDGDPLASPVVAPRIPSVADLGGAQFQDDAEYPPDPLIFPSALDENQQERVLSGLAQTAGKLVFTIDFATGAPFVSGFAQVGTRLTTGLLTVTDNGAGDTTVAWPAGYLPARNVSPLMTVNGDVEIDRQRCILAADGLSVRVKTKLGATGTDVKFTVVIL
jgi:hypothetical protein